MRDERPDLLAFFSQLDATLVVPLVRSGEVTGLIAVGQRAAGGPMSADDVDVLRTLASASAVALANAAAVSALQSTQEQLSTAERLAAIGELAAAVAHGLRNPLAGIRITAQVGMRQLTGETPLREHFQEVVTEVDKIEEQVRSLLDFARPFEPQLEATDVHAVLEPVLETIAPRLAERRVSVHVDAPRELPPLLADRVHLAQVLHEILANAHDAMPDGGRITITAGLVEPRKTAMRLSIADTGPGIPEELRDRVFKLFATTKATGTGVGLAVVRKIIQRHNGTIAVGRVEPHGTVFDITLPTAATA